MQEQSLPSPHAALLAAHVCILEGRPSKSSVCPLDDGRDLDPALSLDGFASSHSLLHLLSHGRLWFDVLGLAGMSLILFN